MLISFVLKFFWLAATHALCITIGFVTYQENPFVGFVFILVIPAYRLFRRIVFDKGYYILGYEGEVGGDRPYLSRRIQLKNNPVTFKLLFAIEIVIILFFYVDAYAKIGL